MPVWTVIVGQSIICDTVVISSGSGPPHSWGALLREGFLSLNPHWNHLMGHQNCSNQMGGHQW